MIDVKTEGIEGFQKAIRKYELESSKTREEVLIHRTNRFSYALHRIASGVARSTQKRIRATSARKIVPHSKGTRTRRQEKARRIFAAGYIASGFIPALRWSAQRAGRTRASVRAVNKFPRPQGGVNAAIRRGYIDLINSTPGAVEADAKHNISAKAYRNQERDMQRYFQRQQDKALRRSWR